MDGRPVDGSEYGVRLKEERSSLVKEVLDGGERLECGKERRRKKVKRKSRDGVKKKRGQKKRG